MKLKNIKYLIGIVMILVIVVICYIYLNFQHKKIILIDNFHLKLSEIKPNSKIEIIKSGQEYLINSNKYYVREINIADNKILVVAESYMDEGVIYRLYNIDDLSTVLKEIESVIRPINYEQVMHQNIILKDITGDNNVESLFKVEVSTQVTSYEILLWSNGVFENIKIENSNKNWVEFDSLETRSGYIYLTWHGNGVIGKTQYLLSENTLLVQKNIGIFVNMDNSEFCEVRENKDESDYIIIKKDKCDLIWSKFEEYF